MKRSLIRIFHKELTERQLNQIIQLKSIAWPYTYKQHCDWMKSNIKDDDIHVMLIDENELPIAYLNLINIEIIFDDKPFRAFGIGNVCAAQKNRGWGTELILKTNQYLEQNHMIGLLFCRTDILKFYTANNWMIINPEKLEIPLSKDVHSMIFNCHIPFNCIKYHDRLF